MTCQSTEKLLSAYVDQELMGFELASVEAHVRHCPKCQFELEQIEALKSRLAEVASVAAPVDLEARLRATLDKGNSRSFRPLTVVGLVAASGLAAAFLAVQLAGRAPEPAQPIAQQANHKWEVAADSAYLNGSDPLGGGTPVVAVGYARGQ